MNRICNAPNCNNEIEDIKKSDHCIEHRSFCNPIYMKYKNRERYIDKIYNIKDIRSYDIYKLLSYFSDLSYVYSVRIEYRQIAYTKENYDKGHNRRLIMIQENLKQIEDVLSHKYKSKSELKQNNFEELPIGKSDNQENNTIIKITKRFIEDSNTIWLCEIPKYINENYIARKKVDVLFGLICKTLNVPQTDKSFIIICNYSLIHGLYSKFIDKIHFTKINLIEAISLPITHIIDLFKDVYSYIIKEKEYETIRQTIIDYNKINNGCMCFKPNKYTMSMIILQDLPKNKLLSKLSSLKNRVYVY